jgi:hypothetical protein
MRDRVFSVWTFERNWKQLRFPRIKLLPKYFLLISYNFLILTFNFFQPFGDGNDGQVEVQYCFYKQLLT